MMGFAIPAGIGVQRAGSQAGLPTTAPPPGCSPVGVSVLLIPQVCYEEQRRQLFDMVRARLESSQPCHDGSQVIRLPWPSPHILPSASPQEVATALSLPLLQCHLPREAFPACLHSGSLGPFSDFSVALVPLPCQGLEVEPSDRCCTH